MEQSSKEPTPEVPHETHLLSPDEIVDVVTRRRALTRQWRAERGIEEDKALTLDQLAEIRALPEWHSAS